MGDYVQGDLLVFFTVSMLSLSPSDTLTRRPGSDVALVILVLLRFKSFWCTPRSEIKFMGLEKKDSGERERPHFRNWPDQMGHLVGHVLCETHLLLRGKVSI